MAAHKTVTLYLVQSQNWLYNDEYYQADVTRFDEYGEDDLFAEGRPLPLLSFLKKEKAEEHRLALEREARAGQNPFGYGGDGTRLSDFTSLTPAEFRARLAEAGIDLPLIGRNGRTDYHDTLWSWFEENYSGSEEDAEVIWDACDKVGFFTVVPVLVELEGEG